MTTSTLEIAWGYPKMVMHDEILERYGLSNLAHAESVQLDLRLLTILAKHWDQYCYSFHLPMGEMMVILIDIYHI